MKVLVPDPSRSHYRVRLPATPATPALRLWLIFVFIAFVITGEVLAQATPAADPQRPVSLLPVVPLNYVESLILEENRGFTDAPDWVGAPRGEQVLGGVAFRIDGMIELASRSSVARKGAFRERVSIPVPTNRFASIHLLGGTAWRSEVNRAVAEIVFQYADGGTRRTPILYGGNLRRVLRRAFETPHEVLSPLSRCVVTWTSARAAEEGGMMRLYRATFANPEPARAVASIQLESTMDEASLVVLAMTLDPLPAGQRPDPSPDLEPTDPEWSGRLQVTVTGPEGGRTIAGASVSAQIRAEGILAERTDSSDGTGKVLLPIPKSGAGGIELIVKARGFADTRVKLEAKQGGALAEELKVRLLEATDLGGIVKNHADQPIAGVAVEVFPFSIGDDPEFEGPEESVFSAQTVKTDTDGRWVVERVPVRNLRRVGVKFRHPDHDEAGIYSVIDTPGVEAELRARRHVQKLEAAAKVTGVVTDPEGRPVPGARIWVRAMNSTINRKLVADGNGQFRVEGLTVQRTVFIANAQGLSPYATEFVLEPGMQEVRIQMEKGSVFRGRVVGPDNQPLRSAWVRAESADNLSSTPWPKGLLAADFQTRTDDEGRWVWTNGPSLPMPFRIEAGGFVARSSVEVRPNGEEVEVQLQKPVEVIGSVLDDETGQPVRQFQIVMEGRRNYWGSPRDLDTKDGRFSLVLDQGTEGSLRFVSPLHVAHKEELGPGNNGVIQLTIRLKRSEELSGTVVDDTGAPVGGASVALTGGDGGSFTLPLRPTALETRVIKAAADGSFRLRVEGMPTGIVASGPDGFRLMTLSEFRAKSRIQLEPYGSIEGVYRGWTETNRTAGLTLGLFRGEGSEQLGYAGDWTAPSVMAQFGGSFRFDRIPAGRHELIRVVLADTDGAYAPLMTVTVARGRSRPLTSPGMVFRSASVFPCRRRSMNGSSVVRRN